VVKSQRELKELDPPALLARTFHQYRVCGINAWAMTNVSTIVESFRSITASVESDPSWTWYRPARKAGFHARAMLVGCASA
jgi:hypothetical protein